jgi:hypothetical protein
MWLVSVDVSRGCGTDTDGQALQQRRRFIRTRSPFMSKPLITVFGATGAQGGGLARALLQSDDRPFRVRAVTRKPGGPAARALSELGAEIVAADLDDPASVQRAMQGAHGAFCVTNYWEYFSPEREIKQADTMAEAARLAGVRHVIWSTLDDTRRFVQPDGSRMPVLMGRQRRTDGKGEADHLFVDRLRSRCCSPRSTGTT